MSRKHHAKKHTDRFMQIPHRIMKDPRLINLPPNALKLFIDMLMQFNGKNNGNLHVARGPMMTERGWRSAGTLNKARNDLLEAQLIVETRASFFGRSGRACALYGFTWLQMHYMDGVELGRATPPTWRPLKSDDPVRIPVSSRTKVVRSPIMPTAEKGGSGTDDGLLEQNFMSKNRTPSYTPSASTPKTWRKPADDV